MNGTAVVFGAGGGIGHALVAALTASKFAEARRAFDNVLSVAPKDANSAFLAGLASDRLDKPKDAKRYYERAVRNDGESGSTRIAGWHWRWSSWPIGPRRRRNSIG